MDQMATRILILDGHSSKFHFEISCKSTLLVQLNVWFWFRNVCILFIVHRYNKIEIRIILDILYFMSSYDTKYIKCIFSGNVSTFSEEENWLRLNNV